MWERPSLAYYIYLTTQLPKEVTKPHSEATQRGQRRQRPGQCRSRAANKPDVLTSFTRSVVIGLLLRSMAPSATIMIFSLFLPARFYEVTRDTLQETKKTKRQGSPEAGDRVVETVQPFLSFFSFAQGPNV